MNSTVFPDLYRAGKVELELVPQGTLAERIRAGGAGVPGFYTPASVGTPLAEGKERRTFDGTEYVLEHGLRADFALIKAKRAISGVGFGAWSGQGRPLSSHWRGGAPLLGDLPHLVQGRFSLYDTDLSTARLIREMSAKINTVMASSVVFSPAGGA